MIRQDRLEEQLLSFLQSEILTEEMAAYTIDLFEKELQRKLSELADQYASREVRLEALRQERDQLKAEAERIARAIATTGHSPTLLKLLADSEQKIAHFEARLTAPAAKSMRQSVSDVRVYAMKAIADLRTILKASGQTAKSMLAQHVKKLVLTPEQMDGRWVYRAQGEWELLPAKDCVIWLVARDGSEPNYTSFPFQLRRELSNSPANLTSVSFSGHGGEE